MKKLFVAAPLGVVAILVLASGAQAAEVNLSPLVVEAINDLVVPLLGALLAAFSVWLRAELKRATFLDQQSQGVLAQRTDDILHKAIAFGADEARKRLDAQAITVDTGNDFIRNAAIDYALRHAPDTMKQAGKGAADKLQELLAEKVQARMDAHPAVAALRADADRVMAARPADLHPATAAA